MNTVIGSVPPRAGPLVRVVTVAFTSAGPGTGLDFTAKGEPDPLVIMSRQQVLELVQVLLESIGERE